MNPPRTIMIEVGPRLAGYIELGAMSLGAVLVIYAFWAVVKFFSKGSE